MKVVRDEWQALTIISLSVKGSEREKDWRGVLHLGCLQNTNKDICLLIVVLE